MSFAFSNGPSFSPAAFRATRATRILALCIMGGAAWVSACGDDKGTASGPDGEGDPELPELESESETDPSEEELTDNGDNGDSLPEAEGESPDNEGEAELPPVDEDAAETEDPADADETAAEDDSSEGVEADAEDSADPEAEDPADNEAEGGEDDGDAAAEGDSPQESEESAAWPPPTADLYDPALRQCRLPTCAPGGESGIDYGNSAAWRRRVETTASTCNQSIATVNDQVRPGHVDEVVGLLKDLLGVPTGECLSDGQNVSVGVARTSIAAICSRGEQQALPGSNVVFHQFAVIQFTATSGSGTGKVYLDFPPALEALGIADCNIDTRIEYTRQ